MYAHNTCNTVKANYNYAVPIFNVKPVDRQINLQSWTYCVIKILLNIFAAIILLISIIFKPNKLHEMCEVQNILFYYF